MGVGLILKLLHTALSLGFMYVPPPTCPFSRSFGYLFFSICLGELMGSKMGFQLLYCMLSRWLVHALAASLTQPLLRCSIYRLVLGMHIDMELFSRKRSYFVIGAQCASHGHLIASVYSSFIPSGTQGEKPSGSPQFQEKRCFEESMPTHKRKNKTRRNVLDIRKVEALYMYRTGGKEEERKNIK